ncbi:uncharacterized protein EV422DRAFT_329767 [Fimicolochytrium jonesii]|uniref:uncharacterized protein n=1 Tax=Fimicolochytrium jonesii TaxID=1396493 RepID=UPI0022FEFB7A|nr:uncharacterized protein EV422DRAFT_329767 [Fimicolochytrium jonesii]KAI8816192.1 hypothetical protein EV422DRAFT_329767 [Fimicolochytrium jonesii]
MPNMTEVSENRDGHGDDLTPGAESVDWGLGKNAPKEFPTWTFPENSSAITFGSLNAVSYSESDAKGRLEFLANEGYQAAIYPKGPSHSLCSGRREWTRPERHEQIDKMLAYGEANLFQLGVSTDLMYDHLVEAINVELDSYIRDPFLGNLMQSIDGRPQGDARHGSVALAFAGGESCESLYVGHFGPEMPTLSPTVSFGNPILQIATSSASAPNFVAVRNAGSVTILNKKNGDRTADGAGGSTFGIASNIPFQRRPLHVAFNPILPAEAAVVLDGGDVWLWNGNQHKQQASVIATYEDFGSVYQRRWKTCDYGHHPRTLVVGHFDRVDTIDFRVKSIVPATVFQTRASEMLAACRTDPHNAYQIVIATDRRNALLDTRFPGRPLIEWESMSSEPPMGIEFVDDETGAASAFCTWSRLSGEVNIFEYRQPTPVGQSSDAFHSLLSTSCNLPPISTMRCYQLKSPANFASLGHSVFRDDRIMREIRPYDADMVVPRRPPLQGFALRGTTAGGFHAFHLYADGSMYAQEYSRDAESAHAQEVEADGTSFGKTVALERKSETQASVPDPYRDHGIVDFKVLRMALSNALRNAREVDETQMASLKKIVDSSSVGSQHRTLWEFCRDFWTLGTSYAEDNTALVSSLHFFGSLSEAQVSELGAALSVAFPENKYLVDMSWISYAQRKRDPDSSGAPSSNAANTDQETGRDPIAKRILDQARLLGTQATPVQERSLVDDFPQPQTQSLDIDTDASSSRSLPTATLISPYATQPIQLSATARELRRRWTNPSQYYGPSATPQNSRNNAHTPHRRSRATASRTPDITAASRATSVASSREPSMVPNVRASSQATEVGGSSFEDAFTQSQMWASLSQSQSQSQFRASQVQMSQSPAPPSLSLSQSLIGTGTQASQQSVGEPGQSSKKKKQRRKGF